jgi:N-acetylmuramoyl-L-alanine amidase
MLGMRIVIDAGHGPQTPGKRSPDGSLREYHFNAPTARYVADELLHGYEGVEILMTHDDSRDVPLKERTDRANAWKADLFVSIHANAYGDGGWSSAQGIETFVYETRPAAAVALANAVQRQLVKATGRPDRGVKSANFHVLRETKMTAILVECGFMTHRQEAELLKSDSYRRKCAEAIVAGIVETYGLRRKSTPETAPAPVDEVSEWAKAARDWAVSRGITDGSRPKDTVTREELWTMLYRMSGTQK